MQVVQLQGYGRFTREFILIMKNELTQIEDNRIRSGPYKTSAGDLHGLFIIPFKSHTLKVMSSGKTDPDFEHVSVSLRNRCPNWQEMCFVKDLFWGEDEVVMQLHPAKKDWINNMETCLHLWKPLKQEIPLPPTIAVGLKELNN